MGKHDRKEDTAIDAWLTEYLASYLVQDSGNSNGDNNTIGDNNALGDESADLGASRGGKEANENKKLCQHNNCKRKAKEDCAHSFCFDCCFELRQPCEGHRQQRLKREEEERYIQQGMMKRVTTRFYHFESKFMNFGQTIVIWCFSDFCRNKRWSGELFAHSLRIKRQKNLLKRRMMFSGMDPSDPSGKRKTDAVDDSENAFDSDKNSTVRALTAAVKLEKASEIEQAQTSSRLVRNKGVLAHKGKHPLGKNTLKEDKFFHKEKINRISKHRLDRYNLLKAAWENKLSCL